MIASRILDRLFSYTSHKKNIYIIPTKFGFLYTGILFTIFLIGLSYANNMTLIVAFSMLTYFILQMLNTHKILAKFEWDQLKINSNHSDEGLDLSLRSNAQDIQQINILVDLGDDKVLAQKPTVLSNQYQTKFNLPRGSYNIKKIRFFTLGESSLFYVWKNIVFKQKIYSYPNKKYFNLRELNHFNTSFINEEEFSHHIKYSGQLPAKRIDWKVFAKKDELYWKKHQGENNEVLKLSYKYFNDSLENNLSYLSYLCYEAYKNNYLFSLETHNEFIKENRGPDHLKACLEKLSEV